MSFRLVLPARGRLASALAASGPAILSLLLPCLAEAAYALPRQAKAEAGAVLALVQVSPSHLKRGRLLRAEKPPEKTVEASAPSVAAAAWPDPSLARGAVMALVAAGCLWLAVRGRSVKPIQ